MVNLSADTVVGLLTLLGLMYLAWVQLDLRRAETGANEAEAMESRAGAVSQMTLALMNAVEAVGNRDALIAELRARIEVLEHHDRLKTSRIEELERKLLQMETERQRLIAERDGLLERMTQTDCPEPGEAAEKRTDMHYLGSEVR